MISNGPTWSDGPYTISGPCPASAAMMNPDRSSSVSLNSCSTCTSGCSLHEPVELPLEDDADVNAILMPDGDPDRVRHLRLTASL